MATARSQHALKPQKIDANCVQRERKVPMPEFQYDPRRHGDITTEQRRDDWIAYYKDIRGILEHGRTETEAIGNLARRLCAEGYTLTLQPPAELLGES